MVYKVKGYKFKKRSSKPLTHAILWINKSVKYCKPVKYYESEGQARSVLKGLKEWISSKPYGCQVKLKLVEVEVIS